MTLTVLRQRFSHPEWLFEIKYDGFRGLALAHFRHRECELVSRTGHVYKRFAALNEEIAASLRVRSAVLDREIVGVDKQGKPQFCSLMFRHGPARFYASDVLELNGRDLRLLPAIKRKQVLRRLSSPGNPSLWYVDHFRGDGEELFRLACREDLEGIVGKWAQGPYNTQGLSSWIKLKNPQYSQLAGREELF